MSKQVILPTGIDHYARYGIYFLGDDIYQVYHRDIDGTFNSKVPSMLRIMSIEGKLRVQRGTSGEPDMEYVVERKCAEGIQLLEYARKLTTATNAHPAIEQELGQYKAATMHLGLLEEIREAAYVKTHYNVCKKLKMLKKKHKR